MFLEMGPLNNAPFVGNWPAGSSGIASGAAVRQPFGRSPAPKATRGLDHLLRTPKTKLPKRSRPKLELDPNDCFAGLEGRLPDVVPVRITGLSDLQGLVVDASQD